MRAFVSRHAFAIRFAELSRTGEVPAVGTTTTAAEEPNETSDNQIHSGDTAARPLPSSPSQPPLTSSSSMPPPSSIPSSDRDLHVNSILQRNADLIRQIDMATAAAC